MQEENLMQAGNGIFWPNSYTMSMVLCCPSGRCLYYSCIMYVYPSDLPDMYTQALGLQARGRGCTYQANDEGS